jgi:hypothetical protein
MATGKGGRKRPKAAKKSVAKKKAPVSPIRAQKKAAASSRQAKKTLLPSKNARTKKKPVASDKKLRTIRKRILNQPPKSIARKKKLARKVKKNAPVAAKPIQKAPSLKAAASVSQRSLGPAALPVRIRTASLPENRLQHPSRHAQPQKLSPRVPSGGQRVR